MELKLQMNLFLLLIHTAVSVAVTVLEGQTVTLRCSIISAHKHYVEWKNPKGYTMFFSKNRGVKNKRYNIVKLSETEFIVSISNVTFRDGGNYTCHEYADVPKEKTVEVTVLGLPKIETGKHDGKFLVKCTTAANSHPPQISWVLDQETEIIGHPQVYVEDKKYISQDMLHVKSVRNRITVKCLVHHPALHSRPLINFVKIGRNSKKFHSTTSISSPTTQPQRSAEVMRTTTRWLTSGGRTTRHLQGPSSETVTNLRSVSSDEPKTVTARPGFVFGTATSTGSHSSTTDDFVRSSTIRSQNDSTSNATTTTGPLSVSMATQEIIFPNGTLDNGTRGSVNELDAQIGAKTNSSLLVFLVTCLILALLVVVIFFAIKLRRAHLIWKRENEDSDPSEESHKSKSSQEEKQSQGQRRRGILNTTFTQYIVEEPAVMTSAINTNAVIASESTNHEERSPVISAQGPVRCEIKETEL
ncbi:cytotoxic and regulatory T-cell molecule-like isoform X2 [Thalassophryne amazonica]|uniref:cytotoxic and regulatory T-cell molecule-like isoform X2 n=1 Tax=Thalassophryne amazonica TaxID=390379 RepID=UPI00147225DF|nr:cytotoxic and regulatory T-cell molecule-like isoform X2 [Thalassophryne amazonica]